MNFKKLKPSLFAVAALALTSVSLMASGNEGVVTFAMRTGTWFDPYTDNPSATTEAWLRSHFWRMQSTSPYFDTRTSWYPNAWVYLDLYGIPTDSSLVSQHPDWILKDSSGHFMYIPFACSGGSCSQYAGDPGNASFRSWWVSQAKTILAKGYKGMWIDDVNLSFRVSNGSGTQIAPVDPRTNKAMTLAAWEQYVAAFTKYIRTSIPSTEIVHNSIWFAGANYSAYNDPNVIEEIQQADYIDCERGVSDSGLTGGTGFWSLNNFLSFVDKVHSLGKNTVFDEYTRNGEYGLAGYFLISNGGDAEGDQSMTPNNWWAGYNVNLGTAQAARYTWNGLLRRDFSGGMVLLNPPQASTITVTLPKSYERITGSTVTSITLAAGQGAVLISPSTETAVRIDSGSKTAESDFSADEYATTGTETTFPQPVTTSGVTNAAAAAVYQSKRTNYTAFTYTIPALTSGHTYTVRLHFADDLSSATGQRQFNVAINGTSVLSNFDIFAAAGKVKLKAVVEQFTAKPTSNDEITITFTPIDGKGAALISGIEIIP